MTRAVAVIAVSILILGGLFFALRPDTLADAPRDRTFNVAIKGGEMSPSEISVAEGDRVTLGASSARYAMSVYPGGADTDGLGEHERRSW